MKKIAAAVVGCIAMFGLPAVGIAGNLLISAKADKTELHAGESCTVLCMVKRPTDVVITVADAQGKVVRRTYAYQTALRGEYAWDGKDSSGNAAPAGAYTISIQVAQAPRLDTTFGTNGAMTQFISPYDVQIDKNGNIFVADTGEASVLEFTPDGKPYAGFGKDGKLKYAEGSHPPMAVRVDDEGNVYAGGPFHNISKFDKTGKLLMTIGQYTNKPVGTTFCVGIGLAGPEKLYFLMGAFEGSPFVFNPNFAGLDGWMYKPSDTLHYLPPIPPKMSMAFYGYVGPAGKSTLKGDIYLLGHWSQLMKTVDTGSDIVKKYDVVAGPDGVAMCSPTGLDIGTDGSIWVADWGNGRIIRFADTGTALVPNWQFGKRGEGKLEEGNLLNPHSVCLSPDGKYMYVVEDGEPVYDYAKKDKTDQFGPHRLSKWDVSVFADSAEAKVAVLK